ncbi:hypothetical protein MMC10_009095 [Thelotrema lepadinum]|nr:hypothetical protein [Thelotrema lepadinum]
MRSTWSLGRSTQNLSKAFHLSQSFSARRSEQARCTASYQSRLPSRYQHGTPSWRQAFLQEDPHSPLTGPPILTDPIRNARTFVEGEDDYLAEQLAAQEPEPEQQQEDRMSTERLRRETSHALQDGDLDTMLRKFLQLSQRTSALEALPSTFLTEIIRNLKPQHFVDPFKLAYEWVHPTFIYRLNQPLRQLRDIFRDYIQALRAITTRLRRAGKRLGIREYTTLLDAARATGDAKLALHLFTTMRKDAIQPDTACYNHFFEALSWDTGYDPSEPLPNGGMHKHRISATNLHRRKLRGTNPWYAERLSIDPQVLRNLVVKEYENMYKEGTNANVTTYCFFMQAMSRARDLKSVKSILEKVWEIDVERIVSSDDQASIFESELEQDAPIYPNQELLFTIAHIFGSHNDIPTALRVVDHVARKYDLLIDPDTFFQLAQWTWIGSRKQGATRQAREPDITLLPRHAFEKLWRTMVSEPYNVKPNELLYHMRIRNFWDSRRRSKMIGAMEEVHGLMEMGKGSKITLQDIPIHDQSRAASDLKQIILLRNYNLFERWAKLVLGGKGFGFGWTAWKTRGVPKFVKSWSKYIDRGGQGVAYSIPTGRVQFHRERLTEPKSMTVELFRTASNEIVAKPTEFCRAEPYGGRTNFYRQAARWGHLARMRNYSPYPDDEEEDPQFKPPLHPPVPPWFERKDVKIWYPPTQEQPPENTHR